MALVRRHRIPTLYTILEERVPRHLAIEEGGAA